MFRKVVFITSLLSLTGLGLDAAITLTERDRDRLKKETVYAIDLIQRYHYKQTPFQELDPGRLIENFYEDLDGSRIFILQDDLEFAQQRFGSSLMSSYLFVGDLYPAFEMFNVYQKRVEDRLKWVQERLGQPFDLRQDETYVIDREDAEWPISMAEADAIWTARLSHEMILELLEDQPQEKAIETLQRRYERMQKFLEEIEIHNVQETFLTSLARMYDPHSNFFSWDSAQEFDIQISNALVGIGAQLRDVDGYCVIERLMPGGPAEMSGALHPGDKIVEVAQDEETPVDVVGMKLRKIVQMIRGAEGSKVRLTIAPIDSPTRKEVVLIRERVELTANLASAELFEMPVDGDKTQNIGVIQLPSFYGEGSGPDSISTSGDVAELIRRLKEQNVEGLVLDLRRNGGGRLDEAVKLTGLFVPKGPVVMKRSFDGKVEEDWDRNPAVDWAGPLIVLVSKGSASASEIVAGALQSMGRAIVVGDETTHGKGTVQAPISLRNAMRSLPFSRTLNVGTVKITVQQFFLPNGESTQNRGVVSDIILPSANSFIMDGEADLPNAMEWDQIQPIEFQLQSDSSAPLALVDDRLLEGLSRRSLIRQNELSEFDFLNRNVQWMRERRERKEVSLNLAVRKQDKDDTEARRLAFEDERNELSRELSYKVSPVLLALTEEKDKSHQDKLAGTPLPNGQSRVNQFYQKVFYYQAEGEEKIHEIWVEYFDFERALPHSGKLADIFTESTSIAITEPSMESILTLLKNRDMGSSFNLMDPFREVLGEDLDTGLLEPALTEFFTELVKINPDVLLERPKLDVHLRESVRIIMDWLAMENWINGTPVAAAKKPKED